MNFLLDVNALIALGILSHQHFPRVSAWSIAEPGATLFTCSITELAFVRIVAQVPAYEFDLSEARTLLLGMKANPTLNLRFVPDSNDISRLPAWVKSPSQTTDGHLVALAHAHRARLATLDSGVPGAFLIP